MSLFVTSPKGVRCVFCSSACIFISLSYHHTCKTLQKNLIPFSINFSTSKSYSYVFHIKRSKRGWYLRQCTCIFFPVACKDMIFYLKISLRQDFKIQTMLHFILENKIRIVFMLNSNLIILCLVAAMVCPNTVSKIVVSMDTKSGDA